MLVKYFYIFYYLNYYEAKTGEVTKMVFPKDFYSINLSHFGNDEQKIMMNVWDRVTSGNFLYPY